MNLFAESIKYLNSGCTGAVRPPDKGELIGVKDLKKSRSVYCTESEYRRLKQFLKIIRIYDCMPLPFLRHKVDVDLFIRILSGESFRKSENFEEILIQSFVSQKEGLYNSLCNETYEIATLNAVQVLGVEEEYKKAAEETEDWMKPENCFPNLYQDNKE